MTQTEKLLRELIALPSVNPAFLPAGAPFAGEQRVAEFLAARARKAGLEVELRTVLAGRPNLFVRLRPAAKSKQRVVLVPHLDTVGGQELPGKFFTPQAKGDRLYGRGACDTKGSVAVMLGALLDLAQSGPRPAHTEILFAGIIDEECAQKGSRTLVANGLKANLAIVGEPTQLKIVTAHKGVLWLKIKTHGQAAHGSHPELGCNAVHLMARIVDALETQYAAGLRQRRHPLLGQATVNVGAMHGGTQPNIVPAECTSLVDRRVLPGENEAQIIREINRLIQAQRLPGGKQGLSYSKIGGHPISGPSIELRKWQRAPCLPLATDPKLPLVKLFLHSASQKSPAAVDYFSDAGVLSHGGIPSVLFGPGNIAQAHKPDEWVSLKQLAQGKELLLRFLRSLP